MAIDHRDVGPGPGAAGRVRGCGRILASGIARVASLAPFHGLVEGQDVGPVQVHDHGGRAGFVGLYFRELDRHATRVFAQHARVRRFIDASALALPERVAARAFDFTNAVGERQAGGDSEALQQRLQLALVTRLGVGLALSPSQCDQENRGAFEAHKPS